MCLNIDSISENQIIANFKNVFGKLGRLKSAYNIRLREDAIPYAVAAPRRVSLALRDKVKQELDRMCEENVIEPITEPTDWCAPMVVVPRRDGRVRLCVDYTELNKFVLRERLILPSVEESLAKIEGGRVFSLLDASNGFWQLPLTPNSFKISTFITPFGRYFFKRLPFEIKSGPEVYQKHIAQILHGLEGVINQADDILVVGRTEEEHNDRLHKVLRRLEEQGITLNLKKCSFGVKKVNFLGHLIEEGNIRPDPEKIKAVEKLNSPTNISQLRNFLGMVNYQMKFIPHLMNMTAPLRILLQKDYEWVWSSQQEQAFNAIKQALTVPPVLATFQRDAETRVAADASTFGLGATLEQWQNGSWKPIMFASRSLSKAETRYAQIEREALALTWACEKFSTYVLGLQFCLITDHKPLVEILGTKAISELSARLQRFRMRLLCFNYKMQYTPGKLLHTPDVLSRNPISESMDMAIAKDVLEEEVYINNLVQALPCSDSRLESIKHGQDSDEECKKIKHWIQTDIWDKTSVYWQYRSELNETQGLLMKGSRLIIPTHLRKEILSKLHEGHLGLVKCRRRAQESVWWPSCNLDIKKLIEQCNICNKTRTNRAEPLISSKLPNGPWQILGADLFKWNEKWYLVIIDYYSRFLEVILVDRLTSEAVIARFKNVFARHGLPYEVRTDGGTQFTSTIFQQFASEYEFKHSTSSPHFPQSNGEAEKAVDIAKRILKKCKDPNKGLLAYRNSPLEAGLSPAQLLYGRKLRTTLPSVEDFKNVTKEKLKDFTMKDLHIKERNQNYFNKRNGTRILHHLKPQDSVWIPDLQRQGKVKEASVFPRSYIIDTPEGDVRRNRRHLIQVHQESRDEISEKSEGPENRKLDRSSLKRSCGKPNRYQQSVEEGQENRGLDRTPFKRSCGKPKRYQ